MPTLMSIKQSNIFHDFFSPFICSQSSRIYRVFLKYKDILVSCSTHQNIHKSHTYVCQDSFKFFIMSTLGIIL